MQRSRGERAISWALALFSIAAVWQTSLPQNIGAEVVAVGISRQSGLYQLAVSGGIALTFVVVTGVAIWFYDAVIWRWVPAFGCERGWWVYALVARRESGANVPIVGLFYLEHTPGGASIRQGHAYYYGYHGPGVVSHRGDWTSEVVWIDREINWVFDMHVVDPEPEGMPGKYEGFVSISQLSANPVAGTQTWRGHFQDFGDRRAVAGSVYAERLRPWSPRSLNGVNRMMRAKAATLMDRCMRAEV